VACTRRSTTIKV